MPNKLRSYREKEGWSQEDLALKLGVSRSSVIRWENEERKPYEYNISMLCELFRVSPDELGFDAAQTEESEKKPAALAPPPPPNAERSSIEQPHTYFVQDRSNQEEVKR